MHRQRGSVNPRPVLLPGAPVEAGRVSIPLRRASDFDLIPVGDPRRTGRARVRDAVWSMDAAGLEKDKGFHFACRTLEGDGVLVARVVSVGGALSRAGILMRSGPQPTADTKAVWLQLAEDGELRALWRHGLGASRVEPHDRSALTPWWLKLARQGTGIQGWGSVNGRDWDLVASIRFHELPATMLVGLAACSGSAVDTTTATFDHVRLVSAPPRPPADSHPWLTVVGERRGIRLAWRRCPGTTYHNVLRATAHGGPYIRIAQGVDGLAFEDTTALEGVPYHYVIDAVGHGRPNLRSNEATGRWSAVAGE